MNEMSPIKSALMTMLALVLVAVCTFIGVAATGFAVKMLMLSFKWGWRLL